MRPRYVGIPDKNCIFVNYREHRQDLRKMCAALSYWMSVCVVVNFISSCTGQDSRQIITLTAAAYLVWKVKSASLYLNCKYLNQKASFMMIGWWMTQDTGRMHDFYFSRIFQPAFWFELIRYEELSLKSYVLTK